MIDQLKKYVKCNMELLELYCTTIETSSIIKECFPKAENNYTVKKYSQKFIDKNMTDQEKKIYQMLCSCQTENVIVTGITQLDSFRSDIKNYLENLSFDGYVLAGNSVTNMINGSDLTGDLDFWVENSNKFIQTIQELVKDFANVQYNVYISMIEIIIPNFVPINVIYTNMKPEETIKRFDFDYCRCYWTPTTGITFTQNCIDCVETHVIRKPIDYVEVRNRRIVKALKYGYTFDVKFWVWHSFLLNNDKKIICNLHKNDKYQYTNVCICKCFWNDLPINDMQLNLPYDVNINETTLESESPNEFREWHKYGMCTEKEMQINVTNPKNVKQSLTEIKIAFNDIHVKNKFQTHKMLPIFTFENDDIDLVYKYIQGSILANPLSNGRYDSFNVNYKYNSLDECSDEEELDKEESKTAKAKVKKSVYKEESKPVKRKVKKSVSKKEESDDEEHEPTDKLGLYSYFRNSDQAYIRKSYLPEDLIVYANDNFDEMYNLHPKERHCIVMYGKDTPSERYSKSYLKTPTCTSDLIQKHSYMYSGLDDSHNYDNLPEVFQPFYDYMKNIDSKYNQVVINWYENGEDYLPHHADCEKDMTNEYAVTTISFNDPNFDTFRSLTFIDNNNNIVKEVWLETGSVVLMNYHANKMFQHGIAKDKRKNIGRRVSMSFRQIN